MSLMKLAILVASATAACGRVAFVVDDCGDRPCPSAGVAFPRLASFSMSDPQSYDGGFQQWASKHKINVIGGAWEGWARDKGYSRDSVVMGIKNQSTIGSLVLQMFWLEDYDPTGAYDPYGTFRPAIAANNWFLWVQGSAGTHVMSASHAGSWQLDMTLSAPADSNGERLEAAYARYADNQYHSGGTDNAASHLDGFVHMVMGLSPGGTSAGDYNRDGTTDSQMSQQAMDWWQAGVRTYVDWLHDRWPTGLIGGSSGANWGEAGQDHVSSLSGAMDVFHYGDAIGQTWSVETTSSTRLVDDLLWTSSVLRSPGYLIVQHDNLSATGSDPYSPSYQAMRYGLCLTLMTDGFYSAATDDVQRFWFDEFAVDVATGRALTFPNVDTGLGYLGQPSGDYQVLPNGVYRRDYTNGIALMNPRGNGTRTVALETEFRKIAGSQAPGVNDGSTGVTSVTLQARDGLILLR